jgi:hypothetical protein
VGAPVISFGGKIGFGTVLSEAKRMGGAAGGASGGTTPKPPVAEHVYVWTCACKGDGLTPVLATMRRINVIAVVPFLPLIAPFESRSARSRHDKLSGVRQGRYFITAPSREHRGSRMPSTASEPSYAKQVTVTYVDRAERTITCFR